MSPGIPYTRWRWLKCFILLGFNKQFSSCCAEMCHQRWNQCCWSIYWIMEASYYASALIYSASSYRRSKQPRWDPTKLLLSLTTNGAEFLCYITSSATSRRQKLLNSQWTSLRRSRFLIFIPSVFENDSFSYDFTLSATLHHLTFHRRWSYLIHFLKHIFSKLKFLPQKKRGRLPLFC